MNKKAITPLMIFGLVWLVVVAVSWFFFPDWQKIPGGLWTLAGLTAVGVLALLKDGAAYIKSFLDIQPEAKKEETGPGNKIESSGADAQSAIGEQARNIKAGQGYIEKVEHYHAAPASASPERHDTIGFIPPAKATTYVYRGEIEKQVRQLLREGGSGAIVGVHAPGGVGKTELAKHAAEELKDQFDGLLWVDVGDKEAAQVVGDMLIHCGIQVEPGASYERQKTELQHYLQTHRCLVILDDLREKSLPQLTDLLPPKPCSALVTSRIQQIGGVNRTFELDRMSPAQARELLEAVLGADVVAAESDSAAKLAVRCAWNPLALEIAARRIRQYQGAGKPIERYFQLAQARFKELRMEGDARWDMQRIFDLSFDDLNEADRERFRSLAAFEPSGFSFEAAAALWEADLEQARAVLSRLINLSLVKSVPTEDERLERYRLHDLLDEYASIKLKDSGDEIKIFNQMAAWLLALFNENYVPNMENKNMVLAERDNLLRACAWAHGQKDAELLARLTTKSKNWFQVYFKDVWYLWTPWLEACLQLGLTNRQLEADARKALGDVQQFRKEMDAALESYTAALKLYQAIGERVGEANVRKALGDVQRFRNEMDAALESYTAALTLYQAVGNRLGEANVLQALGDAHQVRNEMDAALESYTAALKLYQAVGERVGEANVLQAIGDVQQLRKEMDAALENYHAALKLFQAIGERTGEANALAGLSRMAIRRGEIEEAEKQMAQIIAIRRAIGDRYSEGADYGNFALALLNHGHAGKAKEYALKARPIFETIRLAALVEIMDRIIAAADAPDKE